MVEDVVTRLKGEFDLNKFAMHFHDTRGLAVANSLKSYELGMRRFDSSSGGLGGCPYAKGPLAICPRKISYTSFMLWVSTQAWTP